MLFLSCLVPYKAEAQEGKFNTTVYIFIVSKASFLAVPDPLLFSLQPILVVTFSTIQLRNYCETEFLDDR